MIRVTVKTVPHPDPQRLIDMWSGIVLKEIERRELESDGITAKVADRNI